MQRTQCEGPIWLVTTIIEFDSLRGRHLPDNYCEDQADRSTFKQPSSMPDSGIANTRTRLQAACVGEHSQNRQTVKQKE